MDKKIDEADEPTAKRGKMDSESPHKWRYLRLGVIVAALAAGADIIENVKKISEPLSWLGSSIGRQVAAAVIGNEAIRTYFGTKALFHQHPDGVACFGSAHAIALDGSGVKTDLAIVFKRTATPKDCDVNHEGPDDVAFFRLGWYGFDFIGDPELPSAITSWNFAGPAAFREAADSSYPIIHVYMLEDNRIVDVGQIDTVTNSDYGGTNYVEMDDGKVAWVITAASISRVSFDANGRPLVQQLDGKSLTAENRGLHLLSYDAEGHLAFNGDRFKVHPVQVGANAADPHDGDEFVVKMPPGDHLYLVGCNSQSGLTPTADRLGAFTIDFDKKPLVECPLGEHTRFSVRVETQDF